MGAHSKKKFATWAGILLLILSVTLNAHFLRVTVGGDALWNDREAYFFVHRVNRGMQRSWIQTPFLVGFNAIGLIAPPVDNTSASLIVIHIGPSGVDRHELDIDPTSGKAPSRFSPREGRIWANYWPLGGLCWWAGDHFEPATVDEKKRIGDMFQLDGQATSAPGWSKRMLGGENLSVQLESGLQVDVSDGDTTEATTVAISVGQPGEQRSTIFSLRRSAGLTSRSEYLRLFPSPR